LIASDGEASSATANATVTIQNQLPLADAGPDQAVRKDTRVVLNGTASADTDGSVVSYSWQQLSGPPVKLRNADSAVADFRAPDFKDKDDESGQGGDSDKEKDKGKDKSAQLTFRLTVIDNDGGKSADQVIVTVSR